LLKMTMTKVMVFIEVKLATPASSLEISVPRTRYFQFSTFYPLLPATKELIVRTLTFLCL